MAEDENAPGFSAPEPKPKPRPDVREEVLDLWGVAQAAMRWHGFFQQVRNMNTLVTYSTEVWSRKRKTSMDVPTMISNWKDVIVTLCTAHDKDVIDAAEYRMDDLLTPLLTAPVKELREFYTGLSKALRDDRQVPFFIWSIFDVWGECVIKTAPDTAKIKRRRRKLASDIADMAEPHIIPDIRTALVGALMWRDPETLDQIKDDLEGGTKPRLRGKESCLFMVTQSPAGDEHQVML